MYDIYEDTLNHYIITDICEGGELFNEIVDHGKFSEKDAKKVMKQLL